MNGIFDNVGRPPDELQSDAQLQSAADQYLTEIDQGSLFVTVDEEELADLATYRVGPVECAYELPSEPNIYSCLGVPGIEGLVDPAWATGYYLILPPLASGAHTIRFGGKASPPSEFEVDVTYELTVE